MCRALTRSLKANRIAIQEVEKRIQKASTIVKCNVTYSLHLWQNSDTAKLISAFVTWTSNAHDLQVCMPSQKQLTILIKHHRNYFSMYSDLPTFIAYFLQPQKPFQARVLHLSKWNLQTNPPIVLNLKAILKIEALCTATVVCNLHKQDSVCTSGTSGSNISTSFNNQSHLFAGGEIEDEICWQALWIGPAWMHSYNMVSQSETDTSYPKSQNQNWQWNSHTCFQGLENFTRDSYS